MSPFLLYIFTTTTAGSDSVAAELTDTCPQNTALECFCCCCVLLSASPFDIKLPPSVCCKVYVKQYIFVVRQPSPLQFCNCTFCRVCESEIVIVKPVLGGSSCIQPFIYSQSCNSVKEFPDHNDEYKGCQNCGRELKIKAIYVIYFITL